MAGSVRSLARSKIDNAVACKADAGTETAAFFCLLPLGSAVCRPHPALLPASCLLPSAYCLLLTAHCSLLSHSTPED